MRNVMVMKWEHCERGRRVRKVDEAPAKFHQFGVAYEEFETGPGNYSTAIVEYDDGRVDSVPVDMIRFLEPLAGGAA